MGLDSEAGACRRGSLWGAGLRGAGAGGLRCTPFPPAPEAASLPEAEWQVAEAKALVHTLDHWSVVETMVVPTKVPDRKLIFGKGTLEQLTGGSAAPAPLPATQSQRLVWVLPVNPALLGPLTAPPTQLWAHDQSMELAGPCLCLPSLSCVPSPRGHVQGSRPLRVL